MPKPFHALAQDLLRVCSHVKTKFAILGATLILCMPALIVSSALHCTIILYTPAPALYGSPLWQPFLAAPQGSPFWQPLRVALHGGPL